MTRFRMTASVLSLSALIISACATTAQPNDTDAQIAVETTAFKRHIAIRDFPIRSVPTSEGDVLKVQLTGDQFVAKLSQDPSLDWRFIEYKNGQSGYVFGYPVAIVD